MVLQALWFAVVPHVAMLPWDERRSLVMKCGEDGQYIAAASISTALSNGLFSCCGSAAFAYPTCTGCATKPRQQAGIMGNEALK